MKVLFDHDMPFFLAHGGFQIQIEQTMAGLKGIGVQVEPVRWWDDTQRGNVIHYFGRPSEAYVDLVHGKNTKIVFADLLSGLGSRSAPMRRAQKMLMCLAERALPGAFTARMAWNSIRRADACVANTAWEARLMTEVFGARPERVHLIPNGVEKAFFEVPPATRGSWLVCTATITERKRVLELAQAAVRAQTPVWIVGKPYSDTDVYARQFLDTARENPSLIRYEGPVNNRSDLASVYRQARGFVLLSDKETLSISALEASACECPLLLSDLPWARAAFGEHANYCPVPASVSRTALVLKGFYDRAPALPAPPKPPTWMEVAQMFKAVYDEVLR